MRLLRSLGVELAFLTAWSSATSAYLANRCRTHRAAPVQHCLNRPRFRGACGSG
jgi:hypothetical protein